MVTEKTSDFTWRPQRYNGTLDQLLAEMAPTCDQLVLECKLGSDNLLNGTACCQQFFNPKPFFSRAGESKILKLNWIWKCQLFSKTIQSLEPKAPAFGVVAVAKGTMWASLGEPEAWPWPWWLDQPWTFTTKPTSPHTSPHSFQTTKSHLPWSMISWVSTLPSEQSRKQYQQVVF